MTSTVLTTTSTPHAANAAVPTVTPTLHDVTSEVPALNSRLTGANSTVLTARGVSRVYDGRKAVADASIQLRSGRITCLLGPSGCGKSTLLRLIAGLEGVDAGEIEIDGALISAPGMTVEPEGRRVGMVFQDFALFPHLSVTENISFGLKKADGTKRSKDVAELIERFHLTSLAEKWPHTLSSGEQQRVAIARALARSPSVLLLDEPFSGLDGYLRSSVRQSVLTLLKAAGAAVLIVTHDPEEALLISDDLLLMTGGKVLQCGSPEECYFRPVSVEAARLLGEVVVLDGEALGGVVHTPFGAVEVAGVTDGAVSLMVRPEALRFDESGVAVQVREVRFGGAFHTVTFESSGAVIAVRMSGDVVAGLGGSVKVSLDPGRVVRRRQ